MTSWLSCDIGGHVVSVKGEAVLKIGLLFFVVGAIAGDDQTLKVYSRM